MLRVDVRGTFGCRFYKEIPLFFFTMEGGKFAGSGLTRVQENCSCLLSIRNLLHTQQLLHCSQALCFHSCLVVHKVFPYRLWRLLSPPRHAHLLRQTVKPLLHFRQLQARQEFAEAWSSAMVRVSAHTHPVQKARPLQQDSEPWTGLNSISGPA